jgi:hypothetical protein
VNYMPGHEVEMGRDYFARNPKPVAVGYERGYRSVKPEIEAWFRAEVVKSLTILAADYLEGLPALGACGRNLGSSTFFGFDSGSVKNFEDSHTSNAVGGSDAGHRNEINRVSFDDFWILGRVDFHNKPFFKCVNINIHN